MDLSVLRHFQDFWIQEGDLPTQTRVFTLTSGLDFASPMDIATRVVLRRSPPKEVTQNLILLQLGAYRLEYMYF